MKGLLERLPAPSPAGVAALAALIACACSSAVAPKVLLAQQGAPAATPGVSPFFQPLLPERREFKLAPKRGQNAGMVRAAGQQGRVSLVVRDSTLKDALAILAETQNLNIVCADDVNAPMSITLRDVPLDEALTSIVSIAGCTWVRQGNIIQVSSLAKATGLAPAVQGRQVKVFHLDYVMAADLQEAIKGMLSPAGSSHVLARSATDNHKTTEAIVVEDLPSYLPRIEQYILQLDQPPRQVLIQVHVLKVELKDDNRHGINFEHIMSIHGHPFKFRLHGLANPGAPQAFFAELSAGNLVGMIEALKQTTDAKTLASPSVLALNGQSSRVQVGEQLGYRITTTTQTSTLESIEFLNVGVVLEVTPTISRDNQILMNIKPKVSTGQVDATTGLPQEETSEVATDVLLQDGQGIVIGGLIQEQDSNVQSKVSHLGDMRFLGPLFSRRAISKTRNEIIFFLVPRIVPLPACCDECDERAIRAQTPLFQGPLHRVPRPWEPMMPDWKNNPTIYRLPLHHRHCFPGRACPDEVHVLEQPQGGAEPQANPAPEQLPLTPPQEARDAAIRGLRPRWGRANQRPPNVVRLPPIDEETPPFPTRR